MKSVKILNYTIADIYLYTGTDPVERPVPMNDQVLWLNKNCKRIPKIQDIKVPLQRDNDSVDFAGKKVQLSYQHIGEPSGLPEPEDGTIIIVSQLVYNSLFHTRKDVYVMDYGIKNTNGKVIACRTFSRTVYKLHDSPIKRAIDFISDNIMLLDSKKSTNILVELNKFIER